MTTLFSETWTGSDGAAWNGTTWPTIEFTSSSTATIQSNEGELNPNGAGFARVRCLSNSGNMADFDLTAQFTQLGGGAEQYHSIFLRHDGAWSGNNVLNGYRFIIFNTAYELAPYVAGVKGAAVGGAGVSKTWDSNPWFVRIQMQGTAMRVRVWQGAEPGTWEIDATDAALSTGQLSMLSMCGTTSTARPIRWDNLSVDTFVVARKFIIGPKP